MAVGLVLSWTFVGLVVLGFLYGVYRASLSHEGRQWLIAGGFALMLCVLLYGTVFSTIYLIEYYG